jgi:hypothetical protein
MLNQAKNKRRLLFILPLVLILPATLLFDTLIYWTTRPTCLQCGNLLEFLKGASLSVFLVANVVGYKLKKKK